MVGAVTITTYEMNVDNDISEQNINISKRVFIRTNLLQKYFLTKLRNKLADVGNRFNISKLRQMEGNLPGVDDPNRPPANDKYVVKD